MRLRILIIIVKPPHHVIDSHHNAHIYKPTSEPVEPVESSCRIYEAGGSIPLPSRAWHPNVELTSTDDGKTHVWIRSV